MAIEYNRAITFGLNGSARSLTYTGIDFGEPGERSWTIASVGENRIRFRRRVKA